MPVNANSVELTDVLFNGISLDKVFFNGVEVFSKAQPSLVYINSYVGGGGDSVSYNVPSFGDVKAGRKIVVCISLHNGVTQSLNSGSITIGGIAAEIVYNFSPDQRLPICIAVVDEDTLSGGVVQWTGSGGSDFWTLSVFALYDVQSKTPVFVGTDTTVPLSSTCTETNVQLLAFAGHWGGATVNWNPDLTEVWSAQPQGKVTIAIGSNGASGSKTAEPGWTNADGYGADNLIFAAWR